MSSEITYDYNIEDNINNPTWQKRKIYNQAPYLIMPQYKFFIRFGSLLPKFVCYILNKAEQFGDPIPFDFTSYKAVLRLFNSIGEVVLSGDMEVTNQDLGEVTYTWKNLDLNKKDIYDFEVEIIDIDDENNSYTLPEYLGKYKVIVN